MLQAIKRHFSPIHRIYQYHELGEQRGDWPEGLAHFFATPLPDVKEFIGELSLLAFDFETSGVDAQHDQILSIGWVPLAQQTIDIGASEELFVRHTEYVNARSAEIHQLTPHALANGIELDQAMDQLFAQLAGKVALVHGASIEKAFIDHYMQTRFGFECLPCLWVDTLMIEKELTFSGKTHAHTSLQLSDLRADYRLPNYTAHSAGIDALATAELLIAQLKTIFKGHSPRLEKLICR